jgi:hypothetical protein
VGPDAVEATTARRHDPGRAHAPTVDTSAATITAIGLDPQSDHESSTIVMSQAIRSAVTISHLTTATDLPAATINLHTAEFGLPITDSLRSSIAMPALLGIARRYPTIVTTIPSKYPREDGPHLRPAEDGGRQHHPTSGGNNGAEGSPAPLLLRDHAPAG